MFDISRKLKRFEPEIADTFRSVLQSGNLILGDQVREFEGEFAKFLGTEFCIGVGNGTDALEIALKSLQLKAGSNVLTVANAGGYATTSIISSGLQPRFLEIDYKSGNTNLNYCLQADLSNVTAVILTHLYGNPITEIREIVSFFRSKGIPTIEDCAQSHGARIGDKALGTFADLSCFSFYPTKNLGSLGDGGAIVTDNEKLASRVKKLRTYGWSEKYNVELEFGQNSRLDELQAAFLRIFLRHLNQDNESRLEIANRYLKEISNNEINMIFFAPNSKPANHLFALLTENRNDLMIHLDKHQIASGIHYPTPDYLQVGFPVPRVQLDNSDKFAQTVISIPIFPEMSTEEVSKVIDVINSFIPKV